LTDHLRLLWLTPAMDGLFTGASSYRRRFLDRLVLSLDPSHGRRASDFERAMRSRNKLLDEGKGELSSVSSISRVSRPRISCRASAMAMPRLAICSSMPA
ncbi:hypothetical protein ACC717_36915, partial [Rhizobium ruizarguesonis]